MAFTHPQDVQLIGGVLLQKQEMSGDLLQIILKYLNSQNAQLTESQVVQLNNGDLRLYMRNTSVKQRVAVSTMAEHGETSN